MVEKASEGVGCQPGPRPSAKQRPTWEPNPGVVAPAAVWHATQGHPLKAAGALHPAQKLPPSLPQFLATLSFFRALSRPSPTATLSLFSPPGPPPHPTLRSPRDAPLSPFGSLQGVSVSTQALGRPCPEQQTDGRVSEAEEGSLMSLCPSHPHSHVTRAETQAGRAQGVPGHTSGECPSWLDYRPVS